MAKMALGSRVSVFLVACVIFILTVFYASDEIVKNNGKDDSLNMMDVFRQKDVTLVDDVLKIDLKNLEEKDAMYKFYTLISFPLQGVCRVLKHIGGHWFIVPGMPAQQVDGDYFVCMDDIMIKMDKPCLIYSFGIANDWTFEDFMDYRGCEVHAHDPTVDFPAERGENIHFYKLGISTETASNVATLSDILKKNGHTDSIIDYLKIDIEGIEQTVLPQLLKTGALNNVNQLAMELHLSGGTLGTNLHEGPHFVWLLEVLQQLYKINFRVISHKVNMIVGPGHDNLYNLVEVVFMKDNVWN